MEPRVMVLALLGPLLGASMLRGQVPTDPLHARVAERLGEREAALNRAAPRPAPASRGVGGRGTDRTGRRGVARRVGGRRPLRASLRLVPARAV